MTSAGFTHLIRNCSWKFKCNRTWDSLLKVESYAFERTRHCPDCKENVYLISNERDLLLSVEFNKCVAIPLGMTKIHKKTNMYLLGSLRSSNFK